MISARDPILQTAIKAAFKLTPRDLSEGYKTDREESYAAQFRDNEPAFNGKQIPLCA